MMNTTRQEKYNQRIRLQAKAKKHKEKNHEKRVQHKRSACNTPTEAKVSPNKFSTTFPQKNKRPKREEICKEAKEIAKRILKKA